MQRGCAALRAAGLRAMAGLAGGGAPALASSRMLSAGSACWAPSGALGGVSTVWARRSASNACTSFVLPRRLHQLVRERGVSSAAAAPASGAGDGAPAPQRTLPKATPATILHKAPHHDFPRARAVKTRFKTSLKKLNLVCKLVRRARVDAALMQLALSPKVPLPPASSRALPSILVPTVLTSGHYSNTPTRPQPSPSLPSSLSSSLSSSTSHSLSLPLTPSPSLIPLALPAPPLRSVLP